jgi:ribosomal protein S18 acetylase RimI-like enzyme
LETITVREATLDDATELATLLNRFDESGSTPEQVTQRMVACADLVTTFLGEVEGQVVGFACLRLVPNLQRDVPFADLTDLYVDEPFRRRGVARALIAQVEAVARAAGAGDIVLMTGLTNAGAQATYHAAGYTEWALAMWKRLPEAS